MDGEIAIPNDRNAGVVSATRPATASLDLGRVTPGERLWLWRRSTMSGVSSRRGKSIREGARQNRVVIANQLEAAIKLGIRADDYWAAESDKYEWFPEERVLALLEQIEEPPYTLQDALRVARRRSPLTLSQVAIGADVGSRPTFYKLESAGDRRVIAFWRDQGFRFPRKFPIYFTSK